MNRFSRLIPVIFTCVAVPSFGSDPPAPGPVDAAKATSPSATRSNSADTTSPTGSAPATAKPNQLVLDDKTLTQVEVNRLVSQGFKPQKGRGDSVLYCRRETPVGTRFDKKVCLTGEQIKARTQDNKDVKQSLDRNNLNPQGS